ncbi:MAG TPA: shikimate dehydrogenase [Rhodothermales bacterium]
MHQDGKRPIVLLGYPLEHSLSPLIHNTAFEHQGLDFHYTLHPVHPVKLEEELLRLAQKGLVGANVTVPHKEAVVRLLDEKSEVVEAIGAANTISCRREEGGVRLVGENSDVGGFIAPIWKMLPELDDRQVLIFGSGGAARAVGFALTKYSRPRRIVIATRTAEAGGRLANVLLGQRPGFAVDCVRLAEVSDEVRGSTLLVNATPIGMGAGSEESIWSRDGDFHEGQIVYDLVYWPLETRFLKKARLRGARILGGLEMLIAQAALSYAVWTGRKMPVETVRQELQRHLGMST